MSSIEAVIEQALVDPALSEIPTAPGQEAQTEKKLASEPPPSTALIPKTAGYGLTDQTNFLPPHRIVIVYLSLTFALFLTFLDGTVLGTALPTISSHFNGGRASAWIVSSYLLSKYAIYTSWLLSCLAHSKKSSMAFTPLCGRWSDVFGRKPVLLFGMVVFALGSLGCALSRTIIEVCISDSSERTLKLINV